MPSYQLPFIDHQMPLLHYSVNLMHYYSIIFSKISIYLKNLIPFYDFLCISPTMSSSQNVVILTLPFLFHWVLVLDQDENQSKMVASLLRIHWSRHLQDLPRYFSINQYSNSMLNENLAFLPCKSYLLDAMDQPSLFLRQWIQVASKML